MRPLVFAIAIAIGALLSLSGASAQDWPTRPIKILTPLAAGGAADVLGRAVGDALALDVKQSVVIENRPGGGGALAALTVARAEPDGTTILLGTAAALTIGPVLVRNRPTIRPPTSHR
jgi:tripartite-type tricarboxylate transporter receptor subunit TctC